MNITTQGPIQDHTMASSSAQNTIGCEITYDEMNTHFYGSSGSETALRPEIENSTKGISLEEATKTAFGMGVSSSNRIQVMLSLLPFLPANDGTRMEFVKQVWSATDCLFEFRGEIVFRLSGLVEDGEDFRSVLEQNETKWVESLGREFTIFRGCANSQIAGVSWTTNRSVAEGFAKGYRGIAVECPVIVSATCRLEDVLFATNDRDEFEIVVDPCELENIRVLAFSPN